MTESVQPDWTMELTFQQQSVLLLAARGPDGVRKEHPCKDLVRSYRACVLKAAYYRREIRLEDTPDGFMNGRYIREESSFGWAFIMQQYFDSIDELPHHYHLHLMHGAEILGYKHPEPIVRTRWNAFYIRCCDDMHLGPETLEEMDQRLNDFKEGFSSV